MEIAYIGLGSNLGDSQQVLLQAWEKLGTVSGIHLGNLSHPYRTEPVGMVSDNWFVNAAGELSTTLAPAELLNQLHIIERQFGRTRNPESSGYQDRILDLDLLLFGQTVFSDSGLHIPHPSLQDRLFVLMPLAEIVPESNHPLLNMSMKELLAQLQATGENPLVELLEWEDVQR